MPTLDATGSASPTVGEILAKQKKEERNHVQLPEKTDRGARVQDPA